MHDSETIIVQDPAFLEGLSTLLPATPARVLTNYLLWRVAAQSMPYLNKEALQVYLIYSQKLGGNSKLPPRFEKCIGELASRSSVLGNSVGSLYVKKYFDEESRRTAIDMVSEVKKGFLTILDEVEWMDDITKEKAKTKARDMYAHIGYPSELLDMKKLEERYEGLEFKDNDYFGNKLKTRIFTTDKSFSKLRQEVNKTDWINHGTPAVINAWYSFLENSISFPAGILQGVFYSKDRPMYMNYGGIGFIIGHEITHGFDDNGRQFAEDGRLVDWWLPETEAR